MLNRIQINNFKSIRELDLELKDINVLVGANGAGKSNFISFFTLLRNIYNQSLQKYIASQGSAFNLFYKGGYETESISGRVEFDYTNAYFFKLRMATGDSLFFEEEGDQFNKAKGDYGAQGWHTDFYGNGGHSESQLPELKYPRREYVKSYLKSFRVFHFHDTSPSSKMKRKGQIDDNALLREDASNLAAYLYWLQEKHPKNFKKIEMAVRSVAPFFDRFNLSPDRTKADLIQLEWSEKESEMYLNASHLSDGTLRFMALATLLLQPEPPKVILIDEPELGLHPFAIHKLAGLIKKVSATSQILLSTQSTNLVDQFDAEDIITVDRENGQSVFKRHNSQQLAGWLENYSIGDIWNKNIIGGRP